MGFLKKRETIQERLQAVEDRLNELRQKHAAKAAFLEEKKAENAKLLGNVAMTESEENMDALRRGKKTLSMAEEALADLAQQIQFLEEEKRKLEHEDLEATVRTVPVTATFTAKEFNDLLAQALDALKVLKGLHGQLKNKEAQFMELIQLRNDAMRKLGKQSPLELQTGLGALAYLPQPWGFTFTVPDFSKFLNALEYYAAKLENFQAMAAAHPDWQEKDAARAALPQQIGGYGDVGSPRPGFGNRSMPLTQD